MRIRPSQSAFLMKNHLSGFVLALVVALLTGCSNNDTDSNTQDSPAGDQAVYSGAFPIKVLTTTGIVADLVREVGGKHVAVDQLMGAGVDPHLYKPTPKDVSRLSKAEVIVYSGLHLEAGMINVFDSQARKKLVYPVTRKAKKDLESDLLKIDGGYHDPHVWFDPKIWSASVIAMGEEFARFDPAHAEDYRANAKRYSKEVQAVFADGKKLLKNIPKEQRVLISAHDAFSYFGRAFDLEVLAIQGVSTDAEAGVRRINELVEFISTRRVPAVFTESTLSDDNIKSLIEGCRAAGHVVRPGGELYSDALGSADGDAGTYLKMVRHNIQTVAATLGEQDE